jgi:hypothetical protein
METTTTSNPTSDRRMGGRSRAERGGPDRRLPTPDLDAQALERCRLLAEIEELLEHNPFLDPGERA